MAGFVGDVGASPPSSQPRRKVIKWAETASSSSFYLRSSSQPEAGDELVKVTQRCCFISGTFPPVMLFFTPVLFCHLKPVESSSCSISQQAPSWFLMATLTWVLKEQMSSQMQLLLLTRS